MTEVYTNASLSNCGQTAGTCKHARSVQTVGNVRDPVQSAYTSEVSRDASLSQRGKGKWRLRLWEALRHVPDDTHPGKLAPRRPAPLIEYDVLHIKLQSVDIAALLNSHHYALPVAAAAGHVAGVLGSAQYDSNHVSNLRSKGKQ